MEIINLIQETEKFIPSQYSNILNAINIIMPYMILILATITCFLGYKSHKFWCKVILCSIAFLIGDFLGILFPSVNEYIFIILGLIFAGVALYFSQHLYKAQIFLFNFILAYIFIPTLLNIFISNEISIILGLIISIIIGVLSVKYTYIVTIIITSITGGILITNQAFNLLAIDKNILFYILTVIISISGCIFQFKFQKDNSKKET